MQTLSSRGNATSSSWTTRHGIKANPSIGAALNRGFLPPYSPDLNPIERLWLLMKEEWFTAFYAKSRRELVDRMVQALNWVIDRKELNKKTCGITTKL